VEQQEEVQVGALLLRPLRLAVHHVHARRHLRQLGVAQDAGRTAVNRLLRRTLGQVAHRDSRLEAV